MKKLASLREYLLSSPLSLQADDLLTTVKQGKVISFQGEDNPHFELRYTANLAITSYHGTTDEVSYWVLQWLGQHQPQHQQEAIAFEATILSPSAIDLSLSIALSEIIKVRTEKEGVSLHSCTEPNLAEALLPQKQPEITVEYAPNGPVSEE